MSNNSMYTNECYVCGHKWVSEDPDATCLKCGELDHIGTDNIGQCTQAPELKLAI